MHEPSFSTVLPRLFLSMLAVIAVMWIVARLLRGRRIGGITIRSTSATPTAVEIMGRQSVGKHGSVMVVRAGNKALVLGVTEQNISLLAQLDEEVIELDSSEESIHWTDTSQSMADASSTQAWKGLLSQIRERTIRKG